MSNVGTVLGYQRDTSVVSLSYLWESIIIEHIVSKNGISRLKAQQRASVALKQGVLNRSGYRTWERVVIVYENGVLAIETRVNVAVVKRRIISLAHFRFPNTTLFVIVYSLFQHAIANRETGSFLGIKQRPRPLSPTKGKPIHGQAVLLLQDNTSII